MLRHIFLNYPVSPAKMCRCLWKTS